jgi:hypothetical protein
VSTIVSYLRERVPVAIFGPAILLTAALALWAAAPVDVGPAGIRAIVLAALIIVQLRVWDDLEDREADAAAHPNRVLVNAPSGPVQIFAWALAVSSGLVIIIGADTWTALACFLLLETWMGLAYRLVRARVSPRRWQYQILLVKYPAIVAVVTLAGSTPPSMGRLLVAAVLTYAGAVAFEIAHNRTTALGATR